MTLLRHVCIILLNYMYYNDILTSTCMLIGKLLKILMEK